MPFLVPNSLLQRTSDSSTQENKMMRILDRYEDLLVIIPNYRPRKGRGNPALMLCVCLLCGNTCTPVASNVRAGRTKSCGNHSAGARGKRLEFPRSYITIHRRLKKEHGSASNYQCADCPRRAEDWSYVGNSPHEHWGLDTSRRSNVAWSPYMRDYTPRCKSCHKKHDNQLAVGRTND